MSAYGLFGLVPINWVVSSIRLRLNEFDKNEQIIKGNVSVAIVDASAAIATAIIIRAVLVWAEDLTRYPLSLSSAPLRFRS